MARAALAAVELAASKHAKRDGERRQQAKKQKREVPARCVPAEYRCVKSTKTEPKSPEAVELTCSVSDHTLEPWRRPPRAGWRGAGHHRHLRRRRGWPCRRASC